MLDQKASVNTGCNLCGAETDLVKVPKGHVCRDCVDAIAKSRQLQSMKEELLEKYRDREPTKFLQFDGWAGVEPGDYVIVPDDDGDALTGSPDNYELMHGTEVRLLIKPGQELKQVMRLLGKLSNWVERDYLIWQKRDEHLNEPIPF